MSQQTIQRQRLLMEVFLLSCLFLHFVYSFYFTIDLFINAKTGNIFTAQNTQAFSSRKYFYSLLSF